MNYDIIHESNFRISTCFPIDCLDLRPNGPIASMSFEETEFNFSEIHEGESIQSVYTFTNTVDKPLILSSVKGSCGCTVPNWPKETILPNESSYLLVQFNSKKIKNIKLKELQSLLIGIRPSKVCVRATTVGRFEGTMC